MEMEAEKSRLQYVMDKTGFISDFERTRDKVVGDGQIVLADLYWESSSLIYAFNELRDHL